MSSFHVVAAASETLRRVLWEEFDADDTIRQFVTSDSAIVFSNPTVTARNDANRLSLWLYQVAENEHIKNQPMVRANGDDTLRYPPLGLNLFYLVTPFGPSGSADHLLLGKTMQVFHDNATLQLQERTSDSLIAEELRIILCQLSLEQLTRIWEALREPYRLSVCYQVAVVRIDSQRLVSQARVVERSAGFRPKARAEVE